MGSAKPRVLGYREQQVLAYVNERGALPSLQTICVSIGIATRGEASRIVTRLRHKQLIQPPCEVRSVRVRANS